MLSVFEERPAEKLHVKLSDGRAIPLEELVSEYERLLKKVWWYESGTKLKVGQDFRIDRRIIEKEKEKIRSECSKVGDVGKELWDKFEEANAIADKEYRPLIDTYVFPHNWEYKTEQEMRDMCKTRVKFREYRNYEGMCDEVICYLELQMRICNGEPIENLTKRGDTLPHVRIIQLRDGGTGYFGGGDTWEYRSPHQIWKERFNPDHKLYVGTPYTFCQDFPHEDEGEPGPML